MNSIAISKRSRDATARLQTAHQFLAVTSSRGASVPRSPYDLMEFVSSPAPLLNRIPPAAQTAVLIAGPSTHPSIGVRTHTNTPRLGGP